MKNFKDFEIKPVTKNFVGDKIKPKKILGKPIVVIDYKIEKSNYADKGDGNRLCLQIELDGEKRIMFSGSTYLKETIKQIPQENFPFATTLIEDNERHLFS